MSAIGGPATHSRVSAFGPELSFMMATSAAMQLHRTSHSCATQHLRWMKINRAEFSVTELPPPVDHSRQESAYLWLV